MRRKLVVGNWKMHGTRSGVGDLVAGLRSGYCGGECAVDIAVCPPYVFFSQVEKALADTGIRLGSQNLSNQASGAYTGEISAQMIVESGCRFAIVGHSERRVLFGETERLVVEKFSTAQAAGLIPIFCIGETAEQREAGQALLLVGRQVQFLIDELGVEVLSRAAIAYEPIWAIGTGQTATPDQAQEMHRHIRQVVADADAGVADNVQILYGGSVSAVNAADLFAMEDIDGALVGGASLNAADFAVICEAASAGVSS